MYPPKRISYTDFDPTKYKDFSPEEEEDEGPISWAWKKITNPVTGGKVRQFMDSVIEEGSKYDPFSSDLLQERMNKYVPYSGDVARNVNEFAKGAFQGGADVAEGFTSPLNLATMGSFGAAGQAVKSAPRLARGLQAIGGALSAPVAIHGGMQIADPNTTLAEKGFGIAELAGGLAGVKQGYSGYGPKVSPKHQTPDNIVLPENFGPEAYAGPERRGPNRPTVDAANVSFQEYRERLARGEDVRSPASRELLEKKTKTEQFREEAAKHYEDFEPALEDAAAPVSEEYKLGETVKYNGQYYEYTGINPHSGRPKWTQVIEDVDAPFELIDEPTDINASGESSASAEAISRASSMKRNGQEYVMYDKDGNASPIIVEDEATQHVPNGKTLAKIGPNGIEVVSHRGGKVPEFNPMQQMGQVPPNIPIIKEVTREPVVIPEKYDDFGNRIDNKYLDAQNTQPLDKALSNAGIPRAAANAAAPQQPNTQQIQQTVQMAQMSPKGPIKDGLMRQALDASRTLITSLDFSAPGRQGLPLIGRKEYWTSLDDMFKAFGSEKAWESIHSSIEQKPYFKKGVNQQGKPSQSFAERAGLDLSRFEENQGSRIAEMIPGVRASNRAFNGFLTKLRADTFENMVDTVKKQGFNPEIDLVLAKQIADFVNNSTGRGSLGRLESVSKPLADLFFSPRLMASKINRYKQILNPKTYGRNTNPEIRKETLKSLFAVTTTGLMFGEIARLAGAQVNNNVNSTDFRKVRVNNTRIDPFGGDQQYLVATARLLSGESTSSMNNKTTDLTAGRFGQQTRASVVSNFFKNKLAPVPSLVWSWMEGKEFDGESFEVKKALLNRTVPLVIQDIYELSQEDPKLIPLSILPVLGVGMQTYGR